ncbi:MutS-related protein [Chishuiella sp.]|uniref:MutS-related protein n=1 Tax=Chishuiella sp. TaxID=1969467 RepID=UPI0028AECCE8|nr:hypothetical protein [Chishuiella sp.]
MIENYINDLNLRKEVFPIFNYCINDLSKQKLNNLLENPLKNIEDIYNRQDIIKGFIQNKEQLSNYKYSKIYFHEVYEFLLNFSDDDLMFTKLNLILFSKQKAEIESRLIQIISIFSKIELNLKKLNLADFPPSYSDEIKFILNFIEYFNVGKYYKINTNDTLDLCKKILEKKSEFNIFFESILLFEVYLSFSKSIIKNNFVFPTISENNFIFKDLYHPLLNCPVSNNLNINKNVIILTGPNMSGKSTFLKSIFISIYLGHLGLAVPASEACFPFFNYFSISINHNDNLKNGYSHFMNEIHLLKNALIQAKQGKKCFVVFDELFKGTNIDDAFNISSQTIKGLLNFKSSFFIISTHLQLLNEIEEIKTKQTANYYIDTSLVDKQPIFTYKLKEGWSNLKIGEILFENEGIKSLLN